MSRLSVVGIVLAAVAAACGGNGPVASNASDGGGGGNEIPPAGRFSIQLQTNGAGAIKGAGADCRGSCTATYDRGVAVHLEAVPDADNVFTGWAGGCSGTAGT